MVFVFDHFGPYHVARVREAAKLPQWKVTGVELHPRSRTYDWVPGEARKEAFQMISLPRVELSGGAERRALRPHLEQILESCNPELVFVNGWGDFMSLETICWAKKREARIVVMSETRRIDGTRFKAGEWLKRRIISLCDSGLCGGDSHSKYLQELGMPKAYVALGYNAVENEFFSQKRNEKEFSDFRFQFSGDIERKKTPTPYFLASNRFVERKNLKGLIRAYAKYVESFQFSVSSFQQSPGVVWPLVLLGDGELRGELEALCEELGIKAFSFQGSVFSREEEGNLKLNSYKLKTPAAGGLVVFAGFRQVEELPLFYGGAGAFVHPALGEPWGLVINEAMASGLPILSSKNVGAAEELVHDGVNGFIFDPENIKELAAMLMKIAEMRREERKAMGEASRRLIAEWGPERFAQGAQEAARAAIAAPRKRVGILDRVLLEILIRK